MELGFKASAQGLLVVAQVAEFLAPFLDGPLVVLVAVLQVDVADEEEAEERGEGEVADRRARRAILRSGIGEWGEHTA